MTGPFRPAVSHLRTLPGRGRKPGQTAIAVFILPANGPNIPGPSFFTESDAPYPPEFPASPLPVKRFQPAHRPFTKQAAILPTKNGYIRAESLPGCQPPAGKPFVTAALPLPISRTRKPAKTGTRRAAPHRPGQQRNPPRLSRTIPIGRLACHNGHRTGSTLIFP